MHLRVERWWIELVHEDPARRLVLWSSEQPFDDDERVEALAAKLGLPILTTSERDGWADWEDDDFQEPPPAKAHGRRTGPGRGSPSMPQQRLNAGVRFASSIPKIIALGVILPLVGGMGWLTSIVAQETRTVLREWQPVEVTINAGQIRQRYGATCHRVWRHAARGRGATQHRSESFQRW